MKSPISHNEELGISYATSTVAFLGIHISLNEYRPYIKHSGSMHINHYKPNDFLISSIFSSASLVQRS